MSNKYGRYVRGGAPEVKKFDMLRPGIAQDPVLAQLVYGGSTLRRVMHNGVINRVRMEGVKPPYILVCNHNAFYDFYVMSSAIYPARGVFPAAVDDFIGREEILRHLGGLPKRKYTSDISMLRSCKKALAEFNGEENAVNPGQMLFGINQGAVFHDIRISHMKQIAELDLPGYAIGGLAVGETHQEMYDTIEAVEEYMPKDRPRYLMGVGTPGNIIEGVARGVDFFDCVMPARNGRHGHLFTWNGIINIKNEKYLRDSGPIDENCRCPVCRRYSRAYLRHLFKAEEMLAMRFSVMHNLFFYNELMRRIRESLEEGSFAQFRAQYAEILDKRI